MRISNETKIGVLTAVGITVLILGFNFLKGKSFFDKRTLLYAEFPSVEGLAPSNPVMINGLQVGTVSGMTEKDKSVSGVIVEIAIDKDLHIPDNSLATINPSLGGLGTTTISIELGNSKSFLVDGGSLRVTNKPGVIDELKKNVTPTIDRINQVMDSLKISLGNINQTLDAEAQLNLKKTIANLAASTAQLQQLLNTQTGALAKTLNNVEAFTSTLAENDSTLTHVLQNVETTTEKLSQLELEKTMQSLESSTIELNKVITQLNSKEGSAGLLLNDEALYRNLENSTRSLNILLDDFRTNPKRYVSFSVFGKKDKTGPLTKPLNLPKDTIRVEGDTVIIR